MTFQNAGDLRIRFQPNHQFHLLAKFVASSPLDFGRRLPKSGRRSSFSADDSKVPQTAKVTLI